MVLLVVKSEEDKTKEECGEPDVPRVVEPLVCLDAAVHDFDGQGDDVDEKVENEKPKVFSFCSPVINASKLFCL